MYVCCVCMCVPRNLFSVKTVLCLFSITLLYTDSYTVLNLLCQRHFKQNSRETKNEVISNFYIFYANALENGRKGIKNRNNSSQHNHHRNNNDFCLTWFEYVHCTQCNCVIWQKAKDITKTGNILNHSTLEYQQYLIFVTFCRF